MTAAAAGLTRRRGVARSVLRYRWSVAVLAVVLVVLMLLYVMLGPVLLAPALVFKALAGQPEEPLHRIACLLYTSPSPRDGLLSRMPSSA